MKRIAIAGGIGAGKSAVSDRLVERGYTVIDTDAVARTVTAVGQPAWRALRDAFGSAVLGPDGTLDRAFLADVVFHDPSALRRLNHITHGYIGLDVIDQLNRATGDAVFVALPLFRPEHRAAFQIDEAWAVMVSPDTAVQRLVAHRGYSVADAQARLANQISNDERAAIVDRVIWNEGSLDDLYGLLDDALSELEPVRG
ncbi:MAG TPA: dephospho-CoA kinase [Acidimicrobiales bacterium]